MNDNKVQEIARKLRHAEEEHEFLPSLTNQFPDLTYDEARRIATAHDELRRLAGKLQLGYKLGWTSTAMREALGIAQPNWGTLWHGMKLGAECSAKAFVHAKAEPEIAFVVGHPLGAEVSATQVLESGGRWALAIEIVDPRWPGYDFTFEENTADNSSAAAFAMADEVVLDNDPGEIEVVFKSADGRSVGRGANAMGSPAQAVVWFCQQLAKEGSALQTGDIILTGGLTAPVDVFPGQKLSLQSEALGAVSVTFVD